MEPWLKPEPKAPEEEVGMVLYLHLDLKKRLIQILIEKKYYNIKVEKIYEDSLDSIPSPSLSVKIQIMGGKVCLMFKSKTVLDQKFVDNAQPGVVNKILKTKSLVTSTSNFLPYYLK